MKKLLAFALCLTLCLGMTGLASATQDKPLIGILAPATTHGWVGGVAYYAQKAADELGLNYSLQTSSNPEEMASQIELMITLGAKAIVVWPQQDSGVELAAEMALEKGIVIYNFDMLINVKEEMMENVYQLTGDNYGMGVEGAKYIAEKLGGKGKVVILDVPTSGNVAGDRKQGFLDTIKEVAPDIEVIATVDTKFVREDGLKDMADVLTAHPEIDAVFSMDDETSIGAIQAIVEAGRTDIKVITGGGGCQEYFRMMLDEKYQGIWVASATYSPSMIVNCIENAARVLAGETVDKLIVFPTTIVDRENVEGFFDENSPY